MQSDVNILGYASTAMVAPAKFALGLGIALFRRALNLLEGSGFEFYIAAKGVHVDRFVPQPDLRKHSLKVCKVGRLLQ